MYFQAGTDEQNTKGATVDILTVDIKRNGILTGIIWARAGLNCPDLSVNYTFTYLCLEVGLERFPHMIDGIANPGPNATDTDLVKRIIERIEAGG